MDEDRDLLLRWVAGFFDGEGSISIGVSGGKIYCHIAVFQRRLSPLLRLASLYPGTAIRRKKPSNRAIKSRGGYEWVANGAAAYLFCREVLPYSILKNDELAVGVELGSKPWRYARSSGVFIARTPSQREDDLRTVRRMKEVKDELRS